MHAAGRWRWRGHRAPGWHGQPRQGLAGPSAAAVLPEGPRPARRRQPPGGKPNPPGMIGGGGGGAGTADFLTKRERTTGSGGFE